MPLLLLTTLLLTGLLLLLAAAVVYWMLRTAVAESPESDPERDGGRTEAQIAADADRSAAALPVGRVPSPGSCAALPVGRVPSPGGPAPSPGLPLLAPHRVCAWCALVQQHGTGPTTHGVCPACAAVQIAQIEADWAATHPHTATRPTVATL